MFKNNSDYIINKSFIDKMTDELKKKEQEVRTRKMHQFVETSECRIKYICKYFGDSEQIKCNNCDNCSNNEKTVDLTTEVNIIIKTVIKLKQCGISVLSKILTGSKAKDLKDYQKKMDTYGSLSSYSQDKIKELVNSLINLDYFEQIKSGDYGNVILLSTTPYGKSLLNKNHILSSNLELKEKVVPKYWTKKSH
jgi:ATP-dependent DNA helicase RecQ